MTSSTHPTMAVPSAADMGRPVRILLVEDSDADVMLTEAALRKAKVGNQLSRARDGEDALAYLRGEPPYEGVDRPDLILLDLNMPKMDGRELLAVIKQDESLRRIPVVVLTTSTAERDVITSYNLSVAGYVTKPVAFHEFVDVIRSLEGFWLNIVHYSPR